MIFYLSPTARLVAVPVQAGPAFSAGQARELFQAPLGENVLDNVNGNIFDVGPDGRFLFPLAVKAGATLRPSPWC